MSNEKVPALESESEKPKLPQLDGDAVEEIPLGELDGVAGGMACPCSCGPGSGVLPVD